MLEFMDYVVRAFERSTHWNTDNNYENITATSDTLINFPIPTSFKFQTSDRSTNNTFNTLEITAHKQISGSLAYLYTDAENMGNCMKGSEFRTLQDSIETYRHIQPFFSKQPSDISENNASIHTLTSKLSKHGMHKSLYYGRIYYPTSILEAMIIKRINPFNQLTIKSLSSVNNRLNVILINWQKYKNENLQELTFSSDSSLCGYRFIHNFTSSPSKFNNALYNNASFSMGGEIWLALSTLTPGCSTSLRYCTHAANTGRPLTLTLSWNPLFGHISSSYSAKTSMNTTFAAKYDFNLYSTDSNLSFGCEFWRKNPVQKGYDNAIKSQMEEPHKYHVKSIFDDADYLTGSRNGISEHQKKLLNDVAHTLSPSLEQMGKEKAIIEEFEDKFNTENYTNVWKFATSLRDHNLRVLWEGKFKGFLLSAGTDIFFTKEYMDSVIQYINQEDKPASQFNNTARITNAPASFGLTIQYST
ncbi:Mitochondrial distribution and morphology protein 10 [Maudiozyma exigua]|uniref:Mitochondrial distribution and morphology protein 10 n=1 Tax=Maudiozyma exigua TaxID=34358 RepID=A0A9P6WEA2_MAUEX|nr:Mitochondrial distribution and morphology protein 10 [Kazachstania exigua]